ncbi:hypothetical protein T265_10619 [Opisthorchis viverrini]|uniref:Uncharacterized protein n=1 Tax=Opisthorchis viverrini TaxID=6198 RepID=A0A074Z5Y6_OPIVI|nr:hypothetical protein T265_10619 [Opisthorchis viverrini]KER20962.1 hypothetical protein T265_10619 [Opisthorchis viverrini]
MPAGTFAKFLPMVPPLWTSKVPASECQESIPLGRSTVDETAVSVYALCHTTKVCKRRRRKLAAVVGYNSLWRPKTTEQSPEFQACNDGCGAVQRKNFRPFAHADTIVAQDLDSRSRKLDGSKPKNLMYTQLPIRIASDAGAYINTEKDDCSQISHVGFAESGKRLVRGPWVRHQKNKFSVLPLSARGITETSFPLKSAKVTKKLNIRILVSNSRSSTYEASQKLEIKELQVATSEISIYGVKPRPHWLKACVN